MIDLPTPFADIFVDRRSENQRDADTRVVAAHVASRAGRAGSATSGGVLGLLIGRRAASGHGVQLRVVHDSSGRQHLVTARDLLVSLPTATGTPPAGTRHDAREPRGLGHLSREPLTDLPPSAASALVQRFEGRLSRFVAADADAGLIDPSIAHLREQGYASSHNCVAVLQQDPAPDAPGHDVVVKLESGPSPTKVTVSSLFLDDRQREPRARIQVAIIDTGITDQERKDGWLDGIAAKGNVDPLDVYPPPGNHLLDFAAGHGTFVAGIIASIEPQAQIVMYKAVDSDGFGSETAVAAALVHAVSAGAQVVSLSLGVRTAGGGPPLALAAAIDTIHEWYADRPDERPVIVAAAGNFGDTTKIYPAGFTDDVVSVAGLTADGEPCAWSSHGDWVTCSTIGEGIVAPYVRGEQDPAFGGGACFPATGASDPWAVWSGTSFAAPQIAAAVARTMREESLSPGMAKDHLLAQGQLIPGWGKAIALLPGTPQSPRGGSPR